MTEHTKIEGQAINASQGSDPAIGSSGQVKEEGIWPGKSMSHLDLCRVYKRCC